MAADEANLQLGRKERRCKFFLFGEYLMTISEKSKIMCVLGKFFLAEAICTGEGWMRDLCLRTDTKTNAARFSAGPVESFSNMVVPQ